MEINNSLHLSIKRLPIFVFFCLICGMVHAENTPWEGGIATTIINEGGNNGQDTDHPILIATAGELAYLAQQTNSGGEELKLTNGDEISEYTNFQGLYFQLTEDIDLNNKEWLLIGSSADVAFKGNFDGNNKTISNLYINTSTYDYAGVFGYIDNSTIQNLHVTISEQGITATGYNAYVGGIAGYMHQSNIQNCDVTGGSITGKAFSTSGTIVGGIAGTNYGGSIDQCFTTVNVNADGMSCSAGGIAGYNDEQRTSETSISNCFSTGIITATSSNQDDYAGGIAGKNNAASITDCHAIGEVTATECAGGIAGVNQNGGSITSCYTAPAKNKKSTQKVIIYSKQYAENIARYKSNNISFYLSAITIKATGSSGSAGGIVGYNYSIITNCYSSIDIIGANVGGITGASYSTSPFPLITYCYSTSKVTGSDFIGGIAGYNMGNSAIKHCLALNISGIENNADASKGRITGYNNSTLNSNFASPLIEGEWDATTLNGEDGQDLTSDNFTTGNGNAFEDWDSDIWDNLDGDKLPILKNVGSNQPEVFRTHFILFTIHYDQPANGTIYVKYTDSSGNEHDVPSGTAVSGLGDIVITAVPNNEYELKELTVNDNPFKSGDTYTVTGDVKISASFDVKPTPPDPDPVIPDPDPTPTVFHSVTLPQVEGATTDPIAGIYEVEAWSSFRFYLTLDKEYDLSEPVVTTDRGETITPRNSDGAYIIKYIRQPVEIYIDNIVKNPDPVANETIKTDQSKVWTEGGCLHIISATTGQLYIYTVEGRLQKKQPVITGETVTIPLPEGFYIIRINNEQFKVII